MARELLGNLKGPQGEQGPQGLKGDTGPQGENGVDGKDGVTPTFELDENGDLYVITPDVITPDE